MLLSTTPKIALENIEAILSTQNNLPPGTTKSLHTTPSNKRTVSPSQNYLQQHLALQKVYILQPAKLSTDNTG